MGIFDFVRNAGSRIFGKDDDKQDVTKPLSAHLRENGIDPSGIQFRFEGDGTVVMSGAVRDQETREKAVLVVGNVEGVARVDDRLWVGAPGSDATASAGTASGHGGWASRTYTVQSGDTLSGIAKAMYGDASAYTRIFEANRPMLEDPDKIYPGQVLRIPS